ncbi:uncharacterized protein LOC118280874 isoform X3 [Spodoptera frugiperda]|uniref:Uncharacterized protein LOC118280874 isoform X3 n=1 Tax=Spodoptera frugiperda TaxID=7108 RepID=A0A9R0DJN3_SPOFR|nr:uncharacterized protein LOC118280874 isoform X3 [Spodoptera frugiperda]
MSDIKSLIKKRASIKAKLTQFSSYLNVAKSCEQLSEVQIVEVEYRLNIFENLYDKYDMLQTDIEETVDDPSEQYAEREEFEKQYYTLVAAARQLISSTRNQASGNSISEIQNANISDLQRFRRIECLKQHFWSRFSHEYILWLQQRTKWHRSSGELKEGTLVVIKDKGSPPLLWLLGRIVKVLPGRDGIARVADIRTRKGVIRRAFNTICPLPVATVVEDTSTGGVC